MPLVENGKVVEDRYIRVADDAPLPKGVPVILSAKRFLSDADALSKRDGSVGVSWPNDRRVAELKPWLGHLALIALDFPKFRDGRAYSQARLLRESLGFGGTLRATGDVLLPDGRIRGHRFPDGLVVTSRMKQYPALGDARESKQVTGVSNRIKVAGTLGPRQGLVRAALAHQPFSVPDVSTSIVRVQLQSPLEFRFGVGPLPLFLIYRCKQDVWFRKVRIQFNCF